MKRIKVILLFILIIIPTIVYGKNDIQITSITDKCQIIIDNKVEIPIKVIALNDGKMSKLITEYKLGTIDNNEEYNLLIKNVKPNTNINYITIDKIKNAENQSNIYYSINKDLELTKNDNIIEFTISIIFDGEIPKKMNILNNEIVLDDQQTCQIINSYKTEIINKEENNQEYPKYQNKLLIIVLSIISLSLICYIIFIKIKMKNDIIKKGE